MPSLFPEIFFLSLYGVTVIRIVTGLSLLYIGIRHFYKKNNFGVSNSSAVVLSLVEIVSGSMLVVGIFTQLSAIFIVLYSILAIIAKRNGMVPSLNEEYILYILLFANSLALLVLGPGLLSFDLPL
jgi:uncharacterized membrane protein YphA (DoxX/SURF4 family)